MDDKAVPAPGIPTPLQRFVGGFRQGRRESLAPVLGRLALGGIIVILAGMAVVAVLATFG